MNSVQIVHKMLFLLLSLRKSSRPKSCPGFGQKGSLGTKREFGQWAVQTALVSRAYGPREGEAGRGIIEEIFKVLNVTIPAQPFVPAAEGRKAGSLLPGRGSAGAPGVGSGAGGADPGGLRAAGAAGGARPAPPRRAPLP